MSKKLPYFQFETSAWLSGDILSCSRITQGVFIHICAIYWERDCVLTSKQLHKRFPDCSTEIEELLDEDILTVVDEFIIIEFLDEQHEKRTNRHKVLSEAGRKGYEAKQRNKKPKPKPESEAKAVDYDKFLQWFNARKGKGLGKVGKFKTLTDPDKKNLRKLKANYSSADFESAIINLFNREWAVSTNNCSPSHFLRIENFNKYLNTEVNAAKHNVNI